MCAAAAAAFAQHVPGGADIVLRPIRTRLRTRGEFVHPIWRTFAGWLDPYGALVELPYHGYSTEWNVVDGQLTFGAEARPVDWSGRPPEPHLRLARGFELGILQQVPFGMVLPLKPDDALRLGQYGLFAYRPPGATYALGVHACVDGTLIHIGATHTRVRDAPQFEAQLLSEVFAGAIRSAVERQGMAQH